MTEHAPRGRPEPSSTPPVAADAAPSDDAGADADDIGEYEPL
ncbi:hypothetical protein [Streptomyces sp. NPDC002463]